MKEKERRERVITPAPNTTCSSEAYPTQNGAQAQSQSRNGSEPQVCAGFYLSKQTSDMLLKVERKHRSDDMALLWFYHYTALWQDTNQPKAGNLYVAKGLGWERKKVSAVRQILLRCRLIENVRVIDQRTRKISAHFVRVRYFSPLNCGKNHDPEKPHAGKTDTNASGLVTNALRANKKPKGKTSFAGFSSKPSFPESESAMLAELEKRGIKIPSAIIQRFYADMQRSQWPTRRGRVRDWIATLQSRWDKIKARLPSESAGQHWRAGKMPLRRMRISGLERLRETLVDEINELFRSDPDANKEQRSELRKRIKDVESEWERKTKRSADELRMKNGAQRSQSEHEAVKNKPIIPFFPATPRNPTTDTNR